MNVEGVQVNLCDVSRTNLRELGWTTTICKSPTFDTFEKPFKNIRQKLKLSMDAQVLNERTNVLIWGFFNVDKGEIISAMLQ